MRVSILLLTAAALLVPQAAYAQSWRHVARSNAARSGPSDNYIDTTRFTRTGDRLLYWQRSVLERQQGQGERRYNEMVVYMEADCALLSYRPLQIIIYLDGREVASEMMEVAAETVSPGTAGDNILRAACAL
ncbi:MAG: hypothetical protein QOI38_1084 [Sphingomonadales bacterium]|jgi:hypothetical protein|nr:hypothetical protein [Sphingomonadales bacterium]